MCGLGDWQRVRFGPLVVGNVLAIVDQEILTIVLITICSKGITSNVSCSSKILQHSSSSASTVVYYAEAWTDTECWIFRNKVSSGNGAAASIIVRTKQVDLSHGSLYPNRCPLVDRTGLLTTLLTSVSTQEVFSITLNGAGTEWPNHRPPASSIGSSIQRLLTAGSCHLLSCRLPSCARTVYDTTDIESRPDSPDYVPDISTLP